MKSSLRRAALGLLFLGIGWLWQTFAVPHFYFTGFRMGSQVMILGFLAAALAVSVWNRRADERERAIEGRAWLGGGMVAGLVAVAWAVAKFVEYSMEGRKQISVGNLLWQAELVGTVFVMTFLAVLVGLHYRMGSRHE